ncbi:putative immunity protein [Streptomyces sp. ZYX-F-203]
MTEGTGGLAGRPAAIVLSRADLRRITGFAAASAAEVLAVFEADRPGDRRPREALDAAWEFAGGGERGKALRDTASGAMRAAKEAEGPGGRDAAWAAVSAAGAAYLHPLPKATQVKHILGAGAHAARAVELAEGGDPRVGATHLEGVLRLATPGVVDVLRRYPEAPGGGGRVGELIRSLDTALRALAPGP